MPKIKRVKVKPAQELYRLKNVKYSVSDCGQFCNLVINDTFHLSCSPAEVFRVVKHQERNISESIVDRYPEIFEEVSD